MNKPLHIPPAFRKADIIVLLLLIAITGLCWKITIYDDKSQTQVEITANGAPPLIVSLSQKGRQLMEVQGLIGISKILIENGTAQFISSPCPHGLCIKMGSLSKKGQAAACVPNRVLLRLISTNEKPNENGLDGISR